jgi:pimeloyl-ACP methyl ester carboxylesterase
VVLIHGLGRTARSLRPLERRLREAGFRTVNLDYASRDATFEQVVADLSARVDAIERGPGGQLHFVTHSLGGQVVRGMLAEHRPADLGRVVMLSPPNAGSEMSDQLAGSWWFDKTMGPIATRLGTDSDDLPGQLGPVDFELGVITGDLSINPVASAIIPGPDDGMVAVESARVDGMADFLVVGHTHTLIMNAPDVAEQVCHFLEQGRFEHGSAEADR